MEIKKLGNIKQVISAYDIVFDGGRESGKECVLVHVGKMEVLFNKSNALDISWVKYKGENLSFLSKNGLNDNNGEFSHKFEGGFLYTCGMDNVSSCVENKPIHGSLHYGKAEEVYYKVLEDRVEIFGKVFQSGLFRENLCLNRHYIVYEDGINIEDTVENQGFTAEKYVLLYHMNYGYPFLDENLEIKMPLIKSEGLTDYAKSRANKQFLITAPIDGGTEEVFYNYLKEGKVTLSNKKLKICCETIYDVKDFPFLLQWKSMISGDYALGIEPSLTRFDEYKMKEIGGGKKEKYKIRIDIKDYE